MVAFLESGLIALGEEPTIRAAIAHNASGGRSIRDNQDMVNLIGDLEGSSNVWAVGRMDALTANASLPEPLAQHLPAVKWFSASSHVGAGVSGLLRAEARDDEAAKNLRDVLQGFLAMAKMHASQKPELAPMVQSLEVSGTGTTGGALVRGAAGAGRRPRPDEERELTRAGRGGGASKKQSGRPS